MSTEPMTFWQPEDAIVDGVDAWLCTPHALTEMQVAGGDRYHFETMQDVVKAYEDLGFGPTGGFLTTTDPDTVCVACRDDVPLDESYSDYTIKKLLSGAFNG